MLWSKRGPPSLGCLVETSGEIGAGYPIVISPGLRCTITGAWRCKGARDKAAELETGEPVSGGPATPGPDVDSELVRLKSGLSQ